MPKVGRVRIGVSISMDTLLFLHHLAKITGRERGRILDNICFTFAMMDKAAHAAVKKNIARRVQRSHADKR